MMNRSTANTSARRSYLYNWLWFKLSQEGIVTGWHDRFMIGYRHSNHFTFIYLRSHKFLSCELKMSKQYSYYCCVNIVLFLWRTLREDVKMLFDYIGALQTTSKNIKTSKFTHDYHYADYHFWMERTRDDPKTRIPVRDNDYEVCIAKKHKKWKLNVEVYMIVCTAEKCMTLMQIK